jgi:tol-pal system protein YbgF
MRIAPRLRNRFLAAAAMAMVLCSAPTPAHAVSKEIIELQTQVQQLLDMVQRLQSTLDARFGALQTLAQQTADQATQMSAAVNTLQQKLNAQNEALGGKVDTVSGQIQSLNDSVDELKSRADRLDKAIQNLQSQLQNIQSPPSMAPGDSATPGSATQGSPAGGQAGGFPGVPAPAANMQMPAAMQAPPLKETYQAALGDYNAGRYQLAASEFGDVVHYYPLDDLAGAAQFYLGEIAYQQKHYEDAVNDYNAVLEGFSGSPKAPTAELHKGLSLLEMKKREAGIHELRLLIQRYPRTPEAARARSRLNEIGVRVSVR